jgi:hypothetical protein
VQSFAAQHNDLEDELNQAQLKLFSIQRRILLESHKSQIFKIKSFKHIMFDPNLMQNEKMKLFVIWSGLQNSRRQLQKFVEDYRKRQPSTLDQSLIHKQFIEYLQEDFAYDDEAEVEGYQELLRLDFERARQ